MFGSYLIFAHVTVSHFSNLINWRNHHSGPGTTCDPKPSVRYTHTITSPMTMVYPPYYVTRFAALLLEEGGLPSAIS